MNTNSTNNQSSDGEPIWVKGEAYTDPRIRRAARKLGIPHETLFVRLMTLYSKSAAKGNMTEQGVVVRLPESRLAGLLDQSLTSGVGSVMCHSEVRMARQVDGELELDLGDLFSMTRPPVDGR
ncbi:MAG: hypothetical protein AAGC55_02040 [Myxococcota bacterium]